MKVLIINDHLTSSGGAETFIKTLEKIMLKKGHKVKTIGSFSGENFSSFFSRWYSLKWYFKVKSVIKKFNPDIIHVNNCVRVVSPSVLDAALSRKTPIVFTLHDFHFLCPRLGGIYDPSRKNKIFPKHTCFFSDCLGYDEKIKNFPRAILKKVKTRFHRRLIKNKKISFVAPSEILAKSMEKSLGIKVSVINNGVDIPKKKTSYQKIILFVGSLNEEKGFQKIAPVLNKIKEYKTIVLGEGPLKKGLEKKYKNIEFLGFKDPKKYYQKASIAVIPSIWMENFSYSVLEAMSYGLCVIGSNIGGIPEQINHQKTGILFEKGNAIDFEKKLKNLLKNESKIKVLGSNSREFAKKNYDWKKIVGKYEKLYMESTSSK